MFFLHKDAVFCHSYLWNGHLFIIAIQIKCQVVILEQYKTKVSSYNPGTAAFCRKHLSFSYICILPALRNLVEYSLVKTC